MATPGALEATAILSESEHTKMYNKVTLDEHQAVAYVRRQLSDGKSLCRYLESVDLAKGVLEAFIPASMPQMSPQHLAEFERGFHFPDGVDRSGPGPLAAVVQQLRQVANPSQCTIVGESFSSRPTDIVLQRLGVRVALFGEEVYFLASPLDERSSLEKLIRRASSIWRSVTVLARIPLSESAAPLMVWQDNDLHSVANAVLAMAFGAYDDEGYVLWTSVDYIRESA
jgi:hypothetical protein